MKLFKRPPDEIISGDAPYLLRWYIYRGKRFKIYLHKFVGDDIDRAVHDHPWPSVSIILKGSYIEHTPIQYRNRDDSLNRPKTNTRLFKRFSIIKRSAAYQHRIELIKDSGYMFDCDSPPEYSINHETYDYAPGVTFYELPRPCTTLFITGRKEREWGFWCPQGFIRWQDFVDPKNSGKVGRGCGDG